MPAGFPWPACLLLGTVYAPGPDTGEVDEKSPYPHLSPSDIPVIWALSEGGFAICQWFPTCGFQKHSSDQMQPITEILCALAQPEPGKDMEEGNLLHVRSTKVFLTHSRMDLFHCAVQGWYSAPIIIVGCQNSKILLNWQVNRPKPLSPVFSSHLVPPP